MKLTFKVNLVAFHQRQIIGLNADYVVKNICVVSANVLNALNESFVCFQYYVVSFLFDHL